MTSGPRKYQYQLGIAIVVAVLSSILALASLSSEEALVIGKWAVFQWTPFPFCSLVLHWEYEAWEFWKTKYHTDLTNGTSILDIPKVSVQDFADPSALLKYLEDTHGVDWIRRPLLLEGLWDVEDLRRDTKRRISKAGLLKENLTIPYFLDARHYGALGPNDNAPVRNVVANITRGAPHKIGTQFLVQTYPELIHEVAPTPIVTALFGNHFQAHHVVGAFGLPFLPATTTVPLFVAGSGRGNEQGAKNATSKSPFTGLHCEPIGNVAVQMEGEKYWTLVSPEHSFLLKPSVSPDGRAFFVSGHKTDAELVDTPRYYATTKAGDALWIPTWTWHRVDYGSRSSNHKSDQSSTGTETPASDQIAIGASLFHLRPKELVSNNPLFAFLVQPALVKELVRFNTQ